MVYWQGGSRGHAMRNCVITGCYGSGLWTAGIASDFRFENNVVDDCRYVWTYQNAASAPPFLYNPDGSVSDIPSRWWRRRRRGGRGSRAWNDGCGRKWWSGRRPRTRAVDEVPFRPTNSSTTRS